MEAVVRVLRVLQPLGFDCVIPFSVRSIEAGLSRLGSPFDFGIGTTELAAPDPSPPDALGLLVANSGALWGPFQRQFPKFMTYPNPLDAYTEASFAEVSGQWEDARTFFSHGALGRRLPIQKIADLSGELPLGPAHLNVHPLYGPWIALRGVLVLPSEPPPKAIEAVTSPCLGCSAPCRPALEEALAGKQREPWPEFAHLSLTQNPLSVRAQTFLRVRGVCPAGRGHRYSDEQILYHYRRAFPAS